MDATNSNTNGSEVANIGYWPSGYLQKFIDFLGTSIASLKGVKSGDAILAAVDFAARSGSDKLPDAVMEEITRRTVVTFEKPAAGAIIYSPTAPDDTTKLWIQTNAQSGIPIGGPKRYDATLAKWVPVDESGDVYVAPLTRFVRLAVPEGNSTSQVSFDKIGTDNFKIDVVPTTRGNGAFNAPPANAPDGYAYYVTGQSDGIIQFSFYDFPTGGLTLDIDITERKDS